MRTGAAPTHNILRWYPGTATLLLLSTRTDHELYVAGPNIQEFPRTISRLTEMRTHDYMALPHIKEGAAVVPLADFA